MDPQEDSVIPDEQRAVLPSSDLPILEQGPPLPDRITVSGNVSLQSVGNEPVQISLNFERLLETQEQVFQRRLTATGEWNPLIPERCWIQGDEVGMIVVRNDEGRHPQVQLSQEQKDELKSRRVLEIALGYGAIEDSRRNYLQIGAKECYPILATLPGLLRVRARAGEVRYTVFVFPR